MFCTGGGGGGAYVKRTRVLVVPLQGKKTKELTTFRLNWFIAAAFAVPFKGIETKKYDRR